MRLWTRESDRREIDKSDLCVCVCVCVCVGWGVECVISIHNTHTIHMTMYMYTVHAVQERSISNYTHVHLKKKRATC